MEPKKSEQPAWRKSEEIKKEKTDISFINTSVEDLQSSLNCAEVNGSRIFNSVILKKALTVVSRRGEKTKARLIQRYIKKAIKKENDL